MQVQTNESNFLLSIEDFWPATICIPYSRIFQGWLSLILAKMFRVVPSIGIPCMGYYVYGTLTVEIAAVSTLVGIPEIKSSDYP